MAAKMDGICADSSPSVAYSNSKSKLPVNPVPSSTWRLNLCERSDANWQQRAAELEEQIRQVGIENVSSAQESLREFAGYRATIDGILGILADMNSASREGVTGIVGALHTQFR